MRDGVDALVVSSAADGALSDALRTLRDDPGLRRGLGTNARIAAEQRWSWDHAVRTVLDALGIANGKLPQPESQM